MSDGELARAMCELKLTPISRAKQLRASTNAGTWRVRDSVEEGARAIAKSREQIDNAVRLLRHSVPDTFLGRKTGEPFANGNDK